MPYHINLTRPSLPAVASVTILLLGQTGDTATLIAVVRDASGAPLVGLPVTWISSNPDIAPVSDTGVVSVANLNGDVTITATCEGVSDTLTVTVTGTLAPSAVSSIVIAPSAPACTDIGSVQLTGTVYDQYGAVMTGQTIAWSSSAPSTASVNGSSGLVTGQAAGTATITATCAGKSASVTVTVTHATAAAVTNLVATVNPDRTVTLTWTDDPGATSYTIEEDGTQIGTVNEGVQTFTTGVGGGAPTALKLNAAALPALAVNPPDFTAYHALGVPSLPAGSSYADPVTSQLVYKGLVSPGLGTTNQTYGDYTNGGSGRHVSFPLDSNGTRRFVYNNSGSGWRVFDFKKNTTDPTKLDITNDRALGIPRGAASIGETQFAFSNNPSTPGVAYILQWQADVGQSVIYRWDTTTDTEAPTVAFPAGGRTVATSTTVNSGWLTVSDDESVVAFQLGASSGTSAYFYHTATASLVTWSPAGGFNEGKLTPDGARWIASLNDGSLAFVDTTTGAVTATAPNGHAAHSASASGNVWPVGDDSVQGYIDMTGVMTSVPTPGGDAFVRWEYLIPTWRQPTLTMAQRYWLAVADSMGAEDIVLDASTWAVSSGTVYVATPTSVGAYANHVGEPMYGLLMVNYGVRNISAIAGNINNLETIVGVLKPVASLAALTAGVQGCFWDQAANKVYVQLADGSSPVNRIWKFARARGGGAGQVLGFQQGYGGDQRLLCHAYTWIEAVAGTDQGSDDYYWRPRPSQSADGAVVIFGSTMGYCGGRADLFITFPPLVSA